MERTATRFIDAHSNLVRPPSLGRALMLVEVRPSNEALLRARVPGAQDQHGCPSNLPPFSSRRGGMMGHCSTEQRSSPIL
jgi:hypothetical protein